MRGSSARSVAGRGKKEASRKLRRRREREAKKAKRAAAQRQQNTAHGGTKSEAVSSSNRLPVVSERFRVRASILPHRDDQGSTPGEPEVTNL